MMYDSTDFTYLPIDGKVESTIHNYPMFLVFCSAATIMLYTILHEFATFFLAQLLEQVIFYLTRHFAGQT